MSTMNVEYFRGPFYITEKDPLDTYKIADCETNKLLRNFINAKDLKRYYDPLKYRIEPQENEDTDTESDDVTLIYDPKENETVTDGKHNDTVTQNSDTGINDQQ